MRADDQTILIMITLPLADSAHGIYRSLAFCLHLGEVRTHDE